MIRMRVGKEVAEVDLELAPHQVASALVDRVYRVRAASDDVRTVNSEYRLPVDFTVNLPRVKHFDVPVSLGDCYTQLGEHETARILSHCCGLPVHRPRPPGGGALVQHC